MLRFRDDGFGKRPQGGPLATKDVDQPAPTLDDRFPTSCGKIGFAGDNRPDAGKATDYSRKHYFLQKQRLSLAIR
ncbi:MAG: hypothetical protein CRU78_04930 [Candidatus Accumulibacter phosphatis]|jgi:hypothetical protein|uniref:Uncharacterized protein n=1 Tax=Candidatus Accumulibacter phosphatis TaxID=327160 RepID=A0A6A7RSL4_9PROT|nr:hypothetical protein [Candidatus Accumulibacter phosphatis]